jgi:hypothetical protein
MCPYLIFQEHDVLCAGSSGKSFSPQRGRQKEYCLGAFTTCVFYQLKTEWFKEAREPISGQ